jgi:hypothetical protein
MHHPRKVFRSFQLALHERLVNDHLRSDVRQFTSLPFCSIKVPILPYKEDRELPGSRRQEPCFGVYTTLTPITACRGGRDARQHGNF